MKISIPCHYSESKDSVFRNSISGLILLEFAVVSTQKMTPKSDENLTCLPLNSKNWTLAYAHAGYSSMHENFKHSISEKKLARKWKKKLWICLVFCFKNWAISYDQYPKYICMQTHKYPSLPGCFILYSRINISVAFHMSCNQGGNHCIYYFGISFHLSPLVPISFHTSY